ATLAAFDQARELLAEAEAVAKKYNRTQAASLLVHEEFTLSLHRKLVEGLRNARVVTDGSQLIPALRVRLSDALNYRGYGPLAVAVIPEAAARQFAAESPPRVTILEL